jgi:plasmid stabilization system protein ParE
LIFLIDHPHSGILTGKGDLRRIVANPYPYLSFYRATADEIVIHSIRHAARCPRD